MESYVPKESYKTNTRLSESVLSPIYYLRGHKVILDSDLASLYSVDTKVLIQAVKRNPERFPDDFMFQLTKQELAILRSQIVTSSWGGRRTPPYVFTEQGGAMRVTLHCHARSWILHGNLLLHAPLAQNSGAKRVQAETRSQDFKPSRGTIQ